MKCPAFAVWAQACQWARAGTALFVLRPKGPKFPKRVRDFHAQQKNQLEQMVMSDLDLHLSREGLVESSGDGCDQLRGKKPTMEHCVLPASCSLSQLLSRALGAAANINKQLYNSSLLPVFFFFKVTIGFVYNHWACLLNTEKRGVPI